MGFPCPHYDAESGCGIAAICVPAAAVLPVARWLPPWAGAPLAALPPALLVGWCGWTWHRVRRG